MSTGSKKSEASELSLQELAAKAALGVINNAKAEAGNLLEAQRRELAAFLTDSRLKVDEVKRELEDAKIDVLGKNFFSVYKKKADDEQRVSEVHERWFGAMLILIAVVACVSGYVNWHYFCGNGEDRFLRFLLNVPKFTLFSLPIFAAAVWFACYKNFKANAAKRLAEFYRHKQYIGATFVGLTSEIRKLGNQNADAAVDLMTNLLRAIINVYRLDPIQGIRDVSAYTPASEATKILQAATGFISSVKKRS